MNIVVIKNLIQGFFLKEFYTEKLYKTSFLLKTASVIFQILIFYFLCTKIDPDYFYFLFIGILFSRMMFYSFTSLNEIIRQEQYWGTIERLIFLPYDEIVIFIISTLPKLSFLFFEIVVYLIIAHFLNLKFSIMNLLFIFFFFLVFNFMFLGFGLFLAGTVLFTKRTESFNWLIISLLDLLSGVYFPTTDLPKELQKIVNVLPTTHSLIFFRSVLNSQINWSSMIITFVYGIIILPLGIIFFRRVLKISLKKGTLKYY